MKNYFSHWQNPQPTSSISPVTVQGFGYDDLNAKPYITLRFDSAVYSYSRITSRLEKFGIKLSPVSGHNSATPQGYHDYTVFDIGADGNVAKAINYLSRNNYVQSDKVAPLLQQFYQEIMAPQSDSSSLKV